MNVQKTQMRVFNRYFLRIDTKNVLSPYLFYSLELGAAICFNDGSHNHTKVTKYLGIKAAAFDVW